MKQLVLDLGEASGTEKGQELQQVIVQGGSNCRVCKTTNKGRVQQ